jgi:hypothetical protein
MGECGLHDIEYYIAEQHEDKGSFFRMKVESGWIYSFLDDNKMIIDRKFVPESR